MRYFRKRYVIVDTAATGALSPSSFLFLSEDSRPGWTSEITVATLFDCLWDASMWLEQTSRDTSDGTPLIREVEIVFDVKEEVVPS